ncbi:MAG: phage tail tape measure protein, partial [Nanoarchaeota archaeon]|nr:phage tail tape measure protein [Nanoarchaeota archaeon]
MATQVGGVYIGVGVRTGKSLESLKNLSGAIKSFDSKIKGIQLEAAIKGDPFSLTKKHIKTTVNAFNSMFTTFKKSMDATFSGITGERSVFGNIATDARKSLRSLMKEFEPLNKQLTQNREKYYEAIEGVKNYEVALKGLKGVFKGINLFDKSGYPLQGAAFKGRLKGLDQETFAKELQGIKILSGGLKNYSDKAVKIVETFEDKVVHKFGKLTSKDFVKFARDFNEILDKELATEKGTEDKLKSKFEKIAQRYSDFGLKIKAEYEKIKKTLALYAEQLAKSARPVDPLQVLDFQLRRDAKLRGIDLDKEGVPQAQRPREEAISNTIAQERAKIITQIKQENIKSLEAIRQGYEVEKNKEKLLRNIQDLKSLNYRLSEKEIKAEIDITRELKKQEKLQFKEDYKKASDVNVVLKERRKKLNDLLIAERKLRTEIKAGIQVDNAKDQIAKILIERRKLGIKLSKEETAEIKRYNAAVKIATKGHSQLFSRKWFQVRAKWFLELRLLWGAYRVLGDFIRDVIDYQEQLSRALRTARSEFKSIRTVAKEYGIVLKAAIAGHAVDYKDLGEVLYQLGSAGLTAEEAMAGLNSTMSLIVGTEGDARDTTKAIAGIYNNFKDTITEVSGEAEKFAYINDLVAAAFKRHQVEIDELSDGYKQSSAMAQAAGVNIKQLTALLAVANDHMIKGGRAGRSLANVWSRISRQPRTFAQVFGVDIDPNKPLDFMDVMNQIAKQFEVGRMSVNELGAAFERMGLRGAPVFATLIQNWDEVGSAIEDFGTISGEAARLEEKRVDNLAKRWKLLINNLKAFAAIIGAGILDDLTYAFKYWGEVLENAIGKDAKKKLQENLLESLFFPDPANIVGDFINEDAIKKLSETRIKALRDMRKRLIQEIRSTKEGPESLGGEIPIFEIKDTSLRNNLELLDKVNEVLYSIHKYQNSINDNIDKENEKRK